MSTVGEVLSAALDLEVSERAEVAHRLLLSLKDDDVDAEADRAWVAEIERRLKAIEDGRTQPIDWDVAWARLQESVAAVSRKR